MKKKRTKSFALLIVISILLTFSLSVFAEEGQEFEEPEVETSQCSSAALITLDIGEVFVISVDEDGLFVSIEAATNDGTTLLGTLDFTGMTLIEIIQSLIDTTEETQEVGISIISCNETLLASLEESLAGAFGEVIETILEEQQEGSQSEQVRERHSLATEHDISPGKMNLLQKLAASSDDELDLDLWIDSSVKDIMKTIKENRKSVEDEEKELESLEDEPEDPEITQEESTGKNKTKEEKVKKNNGRSKGKNK